MDISQYSFLCPNCAQRDKGQRGQGTYLGRKETAYSNWVTGGAFRKEAIYVRGYCKDSVRLVTAGLPPLLNLVTERAVQKGPPDRSCDSG